MRIIGYPWDAVLNLPFALTITGGRASLAKPHPHTIHIAVCIYWNQSYHEVQVILSVTVMCSEVSDLEVGTVDFSSV